MIVDPLTIGADQTYAAMTQSLVPRPVAWVLTDSRGSHNLAPFSYFNAVSVEPPVIMISINRRSTGAIKDTERNIRERGLFVLHIPHVAMVEQEAKNGQDAQLKAFATKELPTLREHLRMAEEINGRIKDTGR